MSNICVGVTALQQLFALPIPELERPNFGLRSFARAVVLLCLRADGAKTAETEPGSHWENSPWVFASLMKRKYRALFRARYLDYRA